MQKESSQIARVTRSKETARATYDRLSRWYDLISATSERKYVKEGLKLLHAMDGEKVLEIGFGTGWALIEIARSVGHSGQVFGIDLSPGMLRKATQKMKKSGLSERVELKTGDAADLPYGDQLFDAIFMSFTLELFDTPEIPVVLGECKRVLAPHGRIGIVSLAHKERVNIAMRAYLWAHERFPNLADCRPIVVAESLGDAGFEIVNARAKRMWGLPVDIVLAQTKEIAD
jgi:demethylmenaquinone methyltransferase/2-methoxy-6-polyprenyl-1,4-benzoquinol methylase